jgi:ComF family protein
MNRLANWLRTTTRQVTDFILPPTCGLCRCVVADPAALCPACWHRLTFTSAPCCACCGHPFDLPVEDGTLCGLCLTDPPLFSRARAALAYDEPARKLIGHFKYAQQTHLLPVFTPWLMRAARELLPADLIMPVPLHRWRLLRRGYNQSALLAQAVGKELALPVDLLTLRRLRSTRPQVGMTREERLKNVRAAFAVTEPKRITGKTILLVDDVLTTGATLHACSEALLAAGAGEIRC